ncbi:efflux transporter outer membrane subunit [Chondrinema litorale]|uniref:efflux transporter outer membrane subunit n=1 Tax=Chondrinema litorale TaxID=2994555 RepID=UPI0025434C45|nr:TolC family protein [Chondrinema litorale]UZR96850.1 TolC family protein [Chondrinema litorale]
MKRFNLSIYIIAGFLLFFVSCRVTKDYQSPNINSKEYLRVNKDHSIDTLAEVPQIPWKSFFTDTLLQNYIEAALVENYDMKIAFERIEIAEAIHHQSKQAFLPNISGNVSVARSKLAFTQGFGIIDDVTQYDLGLSVSWEADIWGKLKSANKAQLARLLQSKAYQHAVQAALITNIASQYYQLIALDEQLNILQRTAENRKANVTSIQKLQTANVVNSVAVLQSQANQYDAEIAIFNVEKQIWEVENALAVLLGKSTAKIERTRFDEINDKSPLPVFESINAELMANRPDVIQAELAYRSAFELTNVARTQFYPSFTLTGAGGFSSFEFSDLFTENIGLFGNVAAGLFQPIFNKGINEANLKTAKSEQQIAFYNFEYTLLKAGQEISDAYNSFQKANLKIEKRVLQLEALSKSVDDTKKLLQYNSQTNYTDVLTSEQNLLAAEIGNVNDILEQKIALINLYRALGGGWNEN